LALLPIEIREVVKELPKDEASRVLQKLLVRRSIEFRPLVEKDLRDIKARTAKDCEFGFKSVDVDLTWKELSRPSYISLGAFADQETQGQGVPVAFVVAEICRQPGGFEQLLARVEAEEEEGTSAASVDHSNARNGGAGLSSGLSPAAHLGATAPLRSSPRELAAAMQAVGCRGPQDLAVAVWYIGVSYEYRRQGLGSQLIDLVREVAEQAGCKSMLLHVAEYNPNAISFYSAYGFTPVPDLYKQGERGRHQLMYMALTPPMAMAGLGEAGGDASTSSSDATPSLGAAGPRRGFGAGMKKGKGGKRRALPSWENPAEQVWGSRPRLAVQQLPGVQRSAAFDRYRFGPSVAAAASAGTSIPAIAGAAVCAYRGGVASGAGRQLRVGSLGALTGAVTWTPVGPGSRRRLRASAMSHLLVGG
ncbi:hypothetical protein VaNZ11_004066, partial [Volvox africanus]